MSWILVAVLTSALPADTLRISAGDFLERVQSRAPGVAAALRTAEAARAQALQTRAWANPSLNVNVDNVGAEEEVTGFRGLRGVEGQAVLAFPLPVGGDRGAGIRRADAQARASELRAGVARRDAIVSGVAALAGVQRDERLVVQAMEEVRTLERLAEALAAQAREGRAADADAARARLEVSIAVESLAQRRGQAASSRSALALVLGVDPGEPIRVAVPACPLPGTGFPAQAPAPPPPDVELAAAVVAAAEGGVDLARAERIPDVAPEVGMRRTMGTQALYAGLSVALPLFDRGARSVDAAQARLASAEAEASDLIRRLDAEVAAARTALVALEEAGSRFTDPGWGADLAATVAAVEARLLEGEGTLVELLEGRRARLQALAARERWAADWRVARARVARLSGGTLDAGLICTPLPPQDP